MFVKTIRQAPTRVSLGSTVLSAHTTFKELQVQVVWVFLNDNFMEWIERRGTCNWPARSLDLTPDVISVCGGLLKKCVFRKTTKFRLFQIINNGTF